MWCRGANRHINRESHSRASTLDIDPARGLGAVTPRRHCCPCRLNDPASAHRNSDRRAAPRRSNPLTSANKLAHSKAFA